MASWVQDLSINNASLPIKESVLEACAANGVEFVEFLIGADAVTIVVSQSNSFLADITSEELYTLWAPEAEDTVTHWNQVNPTWPNEPIQLHGPGLDSGTFDFFTEEVNGQAGAMRADFSCLHRPQ
ncbi:MAG: substrate-binding domain-containing protein [Leptolyngbyaceae cyanobacterium]